jgi:hypothetical protein
MTSRTDKMSAGNSRAAYMREYRKRTRLEEDKCNNVPKQTKVHAERQREHRETHKNMSAELYYSINYCNYSTQSLQCLLASRCLVTNHTWLTLHSWIFNYWTAFWILLQMNEISFISSGRHHRSHHTEEFFYWSPQSVVAETPGNPKVPRIHGNLCRIFVDMRMIFFIRMADTITFPTGTLCINKVSGVGMICKPSPAILSSVHPLLRQYRNSQLTY